MCTKTLQTSKIKRLILPRSDKAEGQVQPPEVSTYLTANLFRILEINKSEPVFLFCCSR
jgi:hypothetical protein